MAKRFIDTGLFDDDWFMDLSKDAKILWLYLITKCDHAGIIKLNIKLCRVQTGINDLETVRQQLGNRLITVGEQLIFIPKFVMFQYPGFPDCKFNTAKSAIAILEKYGLIKNGCLTVQEQLGNSNGNGNGNGKEGGRGETKKEIDYSFVPTEWRTEFQRWINYKKSRKENYKTQESVEACYRNLLGLSNNNLIQAGKVIDQAMGNNWAGLFPLKELKKNSTDVNKSGTEFNPPVRVLTPNDK